MRPAWGSPTWTRWQAILMAPQLETFRWMTWLAAAEALTAKTGLSRHGPVRSGDRLVAQRPARSRQP
jgi:hypothetical protein